MSSKRKPLVDLTNTPIPTVAAFLKGKSIVGNCSEDPENPRGEEIATSNTTRRKVMSSKRKPLVDLTNTPIAIVAAFLKRKSVVGNCSEDPENPRGEEVASSTPKSKGAFVNLDGDSVTHDNAEDTIVYMGRSTAGRKGKAVAVAVSSCPPIGRLKSAKGKQNAEVDLPTAFSVPFQKIKRPCYTKAGELQKPILPQDFIEKQRSYFAEIDAFELAEEVVSESELE